MKRRKITLQSLPIAQPLFRTAKSINPQLQTTNTKRLKNLHHQRYNICHSRGRRNPYQLRPKLRKLPLPACLRPLLPKQLTYIIKLVHRSHRQKIFLKRRPHHTRSHLRTQGQRPPSRIRQKRKHLLSNNIRRRPDASLKKLCILKNRRTYLTEPEQGRKRVHNSFNIFPPGNLFRKNIPRTLNCLILRHTIKIL